MNSFKSNKIPVELIFLEELCNNQFKISFDQTNQQKIHSLTEYVNY